jgi:VWFA-related protein
MRHALRWSWLLVLGGLASPAAAQPTPPLLTSTARLVQVSVVAKEKNGEPAAGLTANDFRVRVDGQPQKLSFFSADTARVARATTPSLAPGTYTNILAERGQAVNGITVVLLDLVNTRLTDRLYARQQLIKYLEEVPPADRIAVYVFNGRLRVLHDYTSDMVLLQQKLAAAKGRLVSVSGAEPAGALDREQSDIDDAFEGRAGSPEEREFFLRNRVLGTLDVFKFIANHLARIPGRKNLIWVSEAFPTIYGYQNARGLGDEFIEEIDATVRALSQANVAVYPIDARGLTAPAAYTAGGGSAMGAGSSRRPRAMRNAGVSNRQVAAQGTMNDLAQRTGGRAYYNTNDLKRAIHQAVEDSSLTYTLGFYPVDEKSDREFHKIQVEVSRPHLNLHYRGGYFDVPRPDMDERQRLLQLHDAQWSPLDATELGLTVKLAASAPAPGSNATGLDVLITIRPDGIQLKQAGDRYDGRIDVLFAQRDARGNALGTPPLSTIDLKLLGETYRKFTTDGLPIRKTLVVAPQADTLKIVVRDSGSGLIGSLTIPLALVKAGR